MNTLYLCIQGESKFPWKKSILKMAADEVGLIIAKIGVLYVYVFISYLSHQGCLKI